MKLLFTIFFISFISQSVSALLIAPPKIDNGEGIIKAYFQDRAIGHIYYNKTKENADMWTICQLWVEKAFRKQKMGSVLLSNCIAHIISLEGKKLHLDIMPIDDVPFDQLLAFYKKSLAKICPFTIESMTIQNPCQYLLMAKLHIDLV